MERLANHHYDLGGVLHDEVVDGSAETRVEVQSLRGIIPVLAPKQLVG